MLPREPRSGCTSQGATTFPGSAVLMLCQDGKERRVGASLRLPQNSYSSVISSLPSAWGKPRASSRTPAARPTHQPHRYHLENIHRSWFNHTFQGALLPTGSQNNEFTHTQAFILFWVLELIFFIVLSSSTRALERRRDGANDHSSRSEEGRASFPQKCWQAACLSRTEAVRQRSAEKLEQISYLKTHSDL